MELTLLYGGKHEKLEPTKTQLQRLHVEKCWNNYKLHLVSRMPNGIEPYDKDYIIQAHRAAFDCGYVAAKEALNVGEEV